MAHKVCVGVEVWAGWTAGVESKLDAVVCSTSLVPSIIKAPSMIKATLTILAPKSSWSPTHPTLFALLACIRLHCRSKPQA